MIKNIDQFITDLLSDFNPKQYKVITGRFGLKTGEKVTLQEIGDELGITRERVRQIEEQALKKITPKVQERASNFLDFSNKQLVALGGVRREDHFINDIMYLLKVDPNIKNVNQKIRFIYLMGGNPFYYREDDDLHSFWYINDNSLRKFTDFVQKLINFFQDSNKRDILENKIHLKHFKDFVESHQLSISKHFGTNHFGDFGLKEWPEIEPKTIRDKIYLVLKKHGKPIHFAEIAKFINRLGLDKKPAHVQTTHNELINDERFVLVGRGIYGLKEHGYEPGTVREVITNLLKKNGPLSAQDVVDSVNERRYFRKNTILINLQNRNYFRRLNDGRYQVRGA